MLKLTIFFWSIFCFLARPIFINAETLSLEQAVQYSLKNNLEIQISSLFPQEKEGSLLRARGDFDLNFSANYDLSDTRTPSSSALDGVSATSFLFTRTRTASLNFKKKFSMGTELQLPYQYPITGSNSTFQRIPLTHAPSLALKVSQPLTALYSFAYFEKKTNEAQYDLWISKRKYDEKVGTALFKVLELFLDVNQAKETVRIKEASYLVSKETFEFTKEKHRVGRSSLIDLLDAESALQKNNEAWLNAQTLFQTKKEELSMQVYAQSNFTFELSDPLKSLLSPSESPPIDVLIEEAFLKRPEVDENVLSLAKAEVTKQAAAVDRYPRLILKGDLTYGSLNQDFTSAHREITQRKFPSWSAEGSLEHSLFMYASKGAYQIASFKIQQEELKKLQTKRNISLEIRKNFRQLMANWKRIEAFEKVVKAENEKYKGEEARFQVGRISVYEFNRSINSQKASELDLIKAKTDYKKSLYRLAHSRGVLLDAVSHVQ